MAKFDISKLNLETEEDRKITYTDEEAEEHAKAVGVPPRPNETLDEINEEGIFVRQANSFITPFGDKKVNLRLIRVDIEFSGLMDAIGLIDQ